MAVGLVNLNADGKSGEGGASQLNSYRAERKTKQISFMQPCVSQNGEPRPCLHVCDWASHDHLLPVNQILNKEKDLIVFFIHVLHNILTLERGICSPSSNMDKKKKHVCLCGRL